MGSWPHMTGIIVRRELEVRIQTQREEGPEDADRHQTGASEPRRAGIASLRRRQGERPAADPPLAFQRESALLPP